MTAPQQPAPPPEEPDGGAGTAVAVAAVGLALLAIESRVRSDVVENIEKVFVAWAALIAAVITSARPATGTELLSRPDVHRGLVKSLKTAQDVVTNSLSSGYTAAAHLALVRATRDLKKLGHEVPSNLPDLGSDLDAIIADAEAAFGHAQQDVQNTVRDAFDAVTGTDPHAARVLTTNAAIRRAAARLRLRINAAATVAVNQGSRDAQLAIFDNFSRTNPYITLAKRWRVTAIDPCGMCEALDGTVISLNTEFDHDATTDDTALRAVWRNLQGPPRHPHCRCQLELVTI